MIAGAAALGAISFGLGLLVGSTRGSDEFDVGESRSRIERAIGSSNPLEQVALIAPVLQTMGPDNVEELAEVFESTFESGGGGLLLELFVESWARFDPQGIHARASSWPADKRREAWPALLRAWARSDPQAAALALEQIPDAAVRHRAWPALIEGWSESDDLGVWRQLSEIPEGAQRSELVDDVVERRMRRRGADELLRELTAIPDDPPMDVLKRDALVSAASRLVRHDLHQALALAEAHEDSVYGPDIRRRVAAYWASQDGSAALAWLRRQPAGSQRDDALARAYRTWLRSDRAAAVAWLGERITDTDVAAVAVAHAGVLAREEPETAIAWARELPDPELRRRALLEIDRISQRNDPDAAARFREGAGLEDNLPTHPPPRT